jgi:uncharacterized YigZ family protein
VKVPGGTCEREIDIRRSRFIGYCCYVDSAGSAKAIVASRRAAAPGCDHVVHAYLVGPHGDLFGMSDDHEPKGTAGRPILEVLRGSGLTNVLIAVTRYFGGTKLGTGGLVRAYTAAAQEVIGGVEIANEVVRTPFRLEVAYDRYETVRRLALERGARLTSEQFTDKVSLQGTIPEESGADFARAVGEATSGAAELTLESGGLS